METVITLVVLAVFVGGVFVFARKRRTRAEPGENGGTNPRPGNPTIPREGVDRIEP